MTLSVQQPLGFRVVVSIGTATGAQGPWYPKFLEPDQEIDEFLGDYRIFDLQKSHLTILRYKLTKLRIEKSASRKRSSHKIEELNQVVLPLLVKS